MLMELDSLSGRHLAQCTFPAWDEVLEACGEPGVVEMDRFVVRKESLKWRS